MSVKQFLKRVAPLGVLDKYHAAQLKLLQSRMYRRLYMAHVRSVAHAMVRQSPQIVYAEATNRCNARCVTCPRERLTRPQGVMSVEMFRKIALQSATAGAREIRLHNYGEPLLDPRLLDKLRIAKRETSLKTGFYTNASLMTREFSEAIVKERLLDSIHVSFDGYTQDTYERIRRGLKFDNVRRNIEGLLETRSGFHSAKPKVNITMVYTRDTVHEVAEFLATWRGRADYAGTLGAHDWAGQQSSIESAPWYEVGTPTCFPCMYLWTRMYVLWNGDVSMCCEDFDGTVIAGNINEESLLDIWRGLSLRRLRQMHLWERQNEMRLCSSCKVIRNNFFAWWNDAQE